MRIVGGRHRGRALRVPSGVALRPTADRVREAVFNILDHGPDWAGVADAAVLDLFAGTGAYGLEALSRGARHVTFVDHHPAAVAGIKAALATLGEGHRSTVLRMDAARLPEPPPAVAVPADLAFLDPPYGSDTVLPTLTGILARGWMAPGALVVLEVAARERFHEPPGARILDQRVYGAARVIFLRPG